VSDLDRGSRSETREMSKTLEEGGGGWVRAKRTGCKGLARHTIRETANKIDPGSEKTVEKGAYEKKKIAKARRRAEAARTAGAQGLVNNERNRKWGYFSIQKGGDIKKTCKRHLASR